MAVNPVATVVDHLNNVATVGSFTGLADLGAARSPASADPIFSLPSTPRRIACSGPSGSAAAGMTTLLRGG